MSIIGFLTGTNPQQVVISRDESGAPGLTLDAAISITPTRQVSITKNPVESGANITDHATLGNLTLSIEGFIAEAPLPNGLLASALGIVAGAAGGLIGTAVGGGGLVTSLVTAGAAIGANKAANYALSPDISSGASVEEQIANRIPGDADYPRKAFDYLLGLQQDRSLIRVVTRLKTYTNLLITDLSAPQTIENGKSIRFTASFEQVQIVESASVSLPENLISGSATGAASKAGLGKQAAGAATSAQTGNVSILKGLVNGFGS